MRRRFRMKAWYLIPLFVILLGAEGYLGLTKMAARNQGCPGCERYLERRSAPIPQAQQEFADACTADQTNAKSLFNNYYLFHNIQNGMPEIYDYVARFNKDPVAGQDEWFHLLSSNQIVNELNHWQQGYHISSTQPFTRPSVDLKLVNDNKLENSVSSVHIVKKDFGQQTLVAHGYNDLINQIRHLVGHDYFPLLITKVGVSAAAPAATGAAGATPGTGARVRVPPLLRQRAVRPVRRLNRQPRRLLLERLGRRAPRLHHLLKQRLPPPVPLMAPSSGVRSIRSLQGNSLPSARKILMTKPAAAVPLQRRPPNQSPLRPRLRPLRPVQQPLAHLVLRVHLVLPRWRRRDSACRAAGGTGGKSEALRGHFGAGL